MDVLNKLREGLQQGGSCDRLAKEIADQCWRPYHCRDNPRTCGFSPIQCIPGGFGCGPVCNASFLTRVCEAIKQQQQK